MQCFRCPPFLSPPFDSSSAYICVSHLFYLCGNFYFPNANVMIKFSLRFRPHFMLCRMDIIIICTMLYFCSRKSTALTIKQTWHCRCRMYICSPYWIYNDAIEYMYVIVSFLKAFSRRKLLSKVQFQSTQIS